MEGFLSFHIPCFDVVFHTKLELHLNLLFELGSKSQQFCDCFYLSRSVDEEQKTYQVTSLFIPLSWTPAQIQLAFFFMLL
jgi:hypothetical protein